MKISILVSILTITAVVLLYESPYILTGVLLVLAAVSLLKLREKYYLYTFLTAAIGGFSSEAICVYFGVWKYTNPQLLDLPLWLPLVWGLAGLFIVNAYKKFIK